MNSQTHYEDQLKQALENLLRYHRDTNRLVRQDAFRKLNKMVSDKIEEIQREEKDD